MSFRLFVAVAMSLVAGLALAADETKPSADKPNPAKPNVILIIADDLGFSDLGCYGGEIKTPNLDKLAAGGLRFTHFYNSHKCEPTRAAVMSGQYWQDAGLGVARGITMGQAMRGGGYATFASGKWHLNGNPVDRGFDRYFGHLSGASDYFKGHASHRLDREPFTPKDDSFYTTDANVDYAIQFIGDSRKQNPDKPFFLYLAFNAPHAPLQAWPEDIAKYRGKFKVGWDVLRQQRYQRMIEMGIIDKAWALSPRPESVPAWDSLSKQEQDTEDLRMSVYAAMVDRMDQAIGRLVADLKANGQLENTLILFHSDNGADPFDRGRGGTLGEKDCHWEYGLGWASLGNTPFQHYKRNAGNGGACTPLIAHWPAGLKTKPGSLSHQSTHIIDLMATFVDVGGVTWPAEYEGMPLAAPAGKSLRPIFDGTDDKPLHDSLYFQLFDHRAVIAGDYKLVSDWGRPWELYNLADDRTELHDLSSSMPDKAKALELQWTTWFEKKPTQNLKSAGGEPTYRRVGEDEAAPKKRKAAPGRQAAAPGIRARIGTKLAVDGNQLVLTCTGDDPGLAITLPGGIKPGPYTVTFRVNSKASGQGEMYWTFDARTKLPNGEHQTFAVEHDGQWHEMSLKIPDAKAINAFRLDPCGGPGEVRIEALKLIDSAGTVVKQWP